MQIIITLLLLVGLVSPFPAHSATVVTVTAFAGRWGKTSLQTRPLPGYTVAVSRDLKCLLGRKVWIEGFGYRYVESVMHKRFIKRVDIYVSSKREARRIKKLNCKMRLV